MKTILLALFVACPASADILKQNGIGSAPLNVLKSGDTMTGQLTTTSTITVQGNAFSVGGSTLVVAGGNVGIGTASPTNLFQVGTSTLTASISGTVSIGTMTFSAVTAPPNSQALCLSGGQMGHCTSVVGVGGGCTCAAP